MIRRDSFYRDSEESFRLSLASEEVQRPRRSMRVLLVDDDPIFLHIMKRAASLKGVSLITCNSAEEAELTAEMLFDAVVVDYMLGSENGIITAKIWDKPDQEVPVILVSQSEKVPSPRSWPSSMREFVHKRLGPFAILEAAVEAAEIADLHREMAIF